MKLWRRFRVVLLACLACGLAIALTNCGSDSAITTDPSPSPSAPATGALVYGSGGQPVSLESGNITDGNSIIVHEQIYNQLLDFVPGTTDIEPSLAAEWDVSEDGLVWTFTLRDDVMFHDGTDFNAAAVVFNINRWWDPEFEDGYRDAGKLYEIWSDLFGGYKGSEESLLQDVAAVDETTVSFTLKQPFAAFPAALASGYFGIASPTAIQAAGADYGTPSGLAVGTGPFVVTEWRSGDRIILEKNPNYWKTDLPKSEQLVIQFIDDPAARLAQLEAGAIDFTVDLTPDQLETIRNNSDVEEVFRPSFNVGYLALNPAYDPLSSVEVRRAIAQAINKEEIVSAFWDELGETNPHFTPPSMQEFQAAGLEDYKYDIEQAKQLLIEAGYPDGFPLELWYMPVSRPYFPNPKPIAEAFAAELGEVGIDVTLQTKDWGAYLEDSKRPPGFQSFMLGWTGDYGDPDNFLYAHFGPGATSDLGNWKNERVFELLDQARAEGDAGIRKELYAEVDRLVFEEAVRIPIVHSQPLLAKQANVEGWTPSPLGSEPFEEVEK